MESLKKPAIKVETEKPFKRAKILVVGDGGVGKTSICKRLAQSSFDSKYTPTIGSDYFSGQIQIGKETLKMCLWDCSGHPEFVEVRNEFYKEANGLLLVYDITSKKSFDGLEMWIREAAKFKGETEIPVWICGNKTDLDSKRMVGKAQGEDMVHQRGFKNLFEVSALSDSNIQKMFAGIANDLKM